MSLKSPRLTAPFLLIVMFLVMALVITGCSPQNPDQKIYKIAIVSGMEAFEEIIQGFTDGMTEQGFIEGENVYYHFVRVNPNNPADEAKIRQIIADSVDLMLTFPTEASLWVKELTRETKIPIVFVMAGIEGNDLVETILHPGGNITGVRYPGPDISVMRLELLRELAPSVKRVWIVYDANYPTNNVAVEMLHHSIAQSDIHLEEVQITGIADIQTDLDKRRAAKDAGFDAILMMPDYFSLSHVGWSMITTFADEFEIPIVGNGNGYFKEKTVLGYMPDLTEMGKQAVPLVNKILNGTPAGMIMVATPISRLQINYKLAQQLGLKVSEGLISRADEIIR